MKVDVRRHLGRIAHRDRVGQQRVEPAADPVERDRAVGVEARDLTARVHAGIGARRADDLDLVLQQLGERLLEVLLHRRPVRLALPAAQRGAVVLDDEPDVTHVRVCTISGRRMHARLLYVLL